MKAKGRSTPEGKAAERSSDLSGIWLPGYGGSRPQAKSDRLDESEPGKEAERPAESASSSATERRETRCWNRRGSEGPDTAQRTLYLSRRLGPVPEISRVVTSFRTHTRARHIQESNRKIALSINVVCRPYPTGQYVHTR
jgi:hypothetical protein